MCRLDPSGGHHLIARPGVKFKFSQTETQKIDFIAMHWWVSKPNIANAQQTRELSAFAKVIANNINNNLLEKLFQSCSQKVPICHQIVNVLLSSCSQAVTYVAIAKSFLNIIFNISNNF